jgi:hypothetical protein
VEAAFLEHLVKGEEGAIATLALARFGPTTPKQLGAATVHQ